jgi:hypothetical protein
VSFLSPPSNVIQNFGSGYVTVITACMEQLFPVRTPIKPVSSPWRTLKILMFVDVSKLYLPRALSARRKKSLYSINNLGPLLSIWWDACAEKI